jgi:hypothetical protein
MTKCRTCQEVKQSFSINVKTAYGVNGSKFGLIYPVFGQK